MQTFDALLREAEVAHGHLCAGQILGVRMAMLGCERLGIDDPKGADRKRLVTFIEIDRCATDAIAVVTGCRLGKRAIKFRDWGKMAATFVDLTAPLPHQGDTPVYRAVRIAALESSRQRARDLYPRSKTRTSSRCSPTANSPTQTSSAKSGSRVPSTPARCPATSPPASPATQCGEGINYDREVRRDEANSLRRPAPHPRPATTSPSPKRARHKQQGRRGNLSATGLRTLLGTHTLARNTKTYRRSACQPYGRSSCARTHSA